KHLQTEAGEPVAIIERQAFSIDDRPIEWRVSYGLASRFSYSVELK
ncbi:MAG: UTRA domain-containing protein, partial [Burkholderiaceae bacterium]